MTDKIKISILSAPMKNHVKLILSLVAAGLLAGCASIVSGTAQVVSINSNVNGADVKVNGSQVGQTPYTGQIKRGKDTVIEVSKPGYGTQTVATMTHLEPIFWGNIIFGGVLGSTTDLVTGACWEYAPASYYVNLTRTGVSMEEFRKDSELKCYAMTHADAIRAELAAGAGEHIDAIYRGFFAGKSTREQFIQNARIALQSARDNAVSVGEQIASLRI